jgi:hypothetical protein
MRFKLSLLKGDGYKPGLLVCNECCDDDHPQERLPDTADPITLYGATGDRSAAVANAPIDSPINLYPGLVAAWSPPSMESAGDASVVASGGKPPLSFSFAWVGDHDGLAFSSDGSTVTVTET